VVRELVDRFWETIHPGYEDGEVVEAIRARPLNWLGSAQEFLASVKLAPVAEPIGDRPRSWFDYEQSGRVDEAATHSDQTAYGELIESGLITGEQWRGALAATPPERLQRTVEIVRGCLEELAGLDAACAERFQEDPPQFIDLRDLLDECANHAEQALGDESAGAAAAADESAASAGAAAESPTPAAAGAPAPPPAQAGGGGPIATRDQAYRQLREVAQFLRRTEPHSPVAALIDRAIKWGDMSFESLFDDVVKDESVRDQVREVLGLRRTDES
jgi:type VI secretion system protein ImpA